MNKLFVEYSNLNKNLIQIIRHLEDSHQIVIFSCDFERNRLEYEEKLIDLEIGADELLMRSESDYSKQIDLRMSFVLDAFNGDEEKAVENTAAIVCSHEPSIEFFRENGFFVLQPDWS
jgi:hypothetical protein